MTNSLIEKREKNIHFELLRIFATFFVIFNHTGKNGFLLFLNCVPNGTLRTYIYIIISIFCKFSVPLFFMISGALMLGRPCEPMQKYLSRIVRFAVILFVFSMVYFFPDRLFTGRESFLTLLKAFFILFYEGKAEFHLWYLYFYIAFLASVPFLKPMAQSLNKKMFGFLIGISLLDGILPIFEYIVNDRFHTNITLYPGLKISWLLYITVLYPCLGFYIQNRLTLKEIKKMLPYVWGVNILCLLVSCCMAYSLWVKMGSAAENTAEYFHNNFVSVNCIALFMTARYLFEGRNFSVPAKKIIISVSSCTLGIYLFHVFFLDTGLYDLILSFFSQLGLNRMISTFIACLGVMVESYIVTFILSKIPVIKKLVGF